jgi:hypothetical protein
MQSDVPKPSDTKIVGNFAIAMKDRAPQGVPQSDGFGAWVPPGSGH